MEMPATTAHRRYLDFTRRIKEISGKLGPVGIITAFDPL
jgi:hypothetical protein